MGRADRHRESVPKAGEAKKGKFVTQNESVLRYDQRKMIR